MRILLLECPDEIVLYNVFPYLLSKERILFADLFVHAMRILGPQEQDIWQEVTQTNVTTLCSFSSRKPKSHVQKFMFHLLDQVSFNV